MNPWSTFAQVAGTAAASLIGLLFVAVSIRIDFIARSQELRNRAAQTLSLFGTVLLTAILIAVPGQATEVLGAELTALAVIAGGGLFVLDRCAKADASTQAIGKTLEMITPTTIVRPCCSSSASCSCPEYMAGFTCWDRTSDLLGVN